MRRSRGFTLLEVLVAVAILGLGLTAILSAQAGAFESAAHARNISVATGLLRCKMNEVEEHLYKEGFQETDETGTGPCCEGDETPNMKCTWRADRPQFPEAKFGDLNLGSALSLSGSPGGGSGAPGPLGAIGLLTGMGMPGAAPGTPPPTSMSDFAKTLADANSQAQSAASSVLPPLPLDSSTSSGIPMGTGSGMGMGSSSGAMGPDMGGGNALGGMASLAMSFVYPSLKLLFEASTRRITASLTFREGKKEYTIDVVEWFAVPQKGLAATDDTVDQTATTPSPNSSARPGAAGPGSLQGQTSPGSLQGQANPSRPQVHQ
jgi:general secretion pathway protein I